MIIFEDDKDRQRFLDRLSACRSECDVEVYSWCLMPNHIHLLLHGQLEDISHLMENVERPYVRYYNDKYDHVGHLFQGRFKSIPVNSDSQLLETVRYIHENPIKAEMIRGYTYRWSSYKEYIASDWLSETARVLDIFGGKEEFIRFHSCECNFRHLPSRSIPKQALSDSEVSAMLSEAIKQFGLVRIPTDDKAKRDMVLSELRKRGASIRQIERVTGIGRNIIAKASC